MWLFGCSATRRRQCSLFLLILFFLTPSPHHHSTPALLFLPSSITFSSSVQFKSKFNKLHRPKYCQYPLYSLTLCFSIFLSNVITLSSVLEMSPHPPLLSSLLFHAFSLSWWRIERSVRVCQHRRGALNLKAHLSPWTSPLPIPQTLTFHLSPFLQNKQVATPRQRAGATVA